MKIAAELSTSAASEQSTFSDWLEHHSQLIVVAIAAAIFLGSFYHAPALFDDIDSAHASIGRTMLESGDWVTPRLDGVSYLEKAPFGYWAIAVSYAIFGVHDWAARIPFALSAILLCWVTARMGTWAFGRRAGLYSGLALATSVGLFLFTRVLMVDVMLTLSVAISMWAFLRALEEDEPHRRVWSLVMGMSLGWGLLIKGLMGLVAPAGGALLYLLLTRQLFSRETWKCLRPYSSALVVLLVAAPWHVLAVRHNPPYFDFSFKSGPGQYRGFFWFYFINEHVLRFLNLRYPRDYDTVPRLQFWLLHAVWLFPWSVFLPAAVGPVVRSLRAGGWLKFRTPDRAGKVRLLALCWTAFVLLFFTLSTTQEYYSMPVYPALALLLGSAMAEGGHWVRRGTRIAGALASAGVIAIFGLLFLVRNIPASADIVTALSQHPKAYTLSLGHMQDLTVRSFAYFRLPLVVASGALLLAALGCWLHSNERGFLPLALAMVIFTQAARMAMVVLEPYLSSRPLAEALRKAPPGELIGGEAYYEFSSVFFYANRDGFLMRRANNLEYGSNAPNAPRVFLSESELKARWQSQQRYYLAVFEGAIPRFSELLGSDSLHTVKNSGGKRLFCNQDVEGGD